jgi:hypothetical protein
MRAGTGHSVDTNSAEAAAEAARAALAQAGTETSDLAMMFATPRHDPAQLLEGLRSVVGPESRIAGGTSFGIVTRDYLGYQGYEVGIALLSADSGDDIDVYCEGGLIDNEFNVGAALGKQISGKDYRGEPNLFFMYDAIKSLMPNGWALNLATPLVAGLGSTLATWPATAGYGMFANLEADPGYQWFDDRIERSSAIAVVLSGGVRMDTIVMHGCKPASGYHTVTKTEHNVLLEIDGTPAVEKIDELLGNDQTWRDNPMYVIFGVNRGDKYGLFEEEKYQNRQGMAIDQERGGLIMFETDLEEGAEIQLMRRSIDLAYMEQRVNQIYERVEGREPFLALYVDCAGRASVISGTDEEEATEIQRLVGTRMPLLGMYSAIEIARVGDEVRPLDWTGVLCIFSQ